MAGLRFNKEVNNADVKGKERSYGKAINLLQCIIVYVVIHWNQCVCLS